MEKKKTKNKYSIQASQYLEPALATLCSFSPLSNASLSFLVIILLVRSKMSLFFAYKYAFLLVFLKMYLWLFLFKLYKPWDVGVGSSQVPFLAVQKAYLIAYLMRRCYGSLRWSKAFSNAEASTLDYRGNLNAACSKSAEDRCKIQSIVSAEFCVIQSKQQIGKFSSTSCTSPW